MSTARPVATAASDAAYELDDAGCKHLTHIWAGWERAVARYDQPDERGHALQEAITVCGTCPVVQACHDLAVSNRYTGVAAGAEFSGGRPRRPKTPRPRLTA